MREIGAVVKRHVENFAGYGADGDALACVHGGVGEQAIAVGRVKYPVDVTVVGVLNVNRYMNEIGTIRKGERADRTDRGGDLNGGRRASVERARSNRNDHLARGGDGRNDDIGVGAISDSRQGAGSAAV